MARFVSCVSLSIISVLLTAGTPPQNSSPLMQGGKEGTGLLSFAGIYNSIPLGTASLTKSDMPDVFMSNEGGMPAEKGLWLCSFDGYTSSGSPLYKVVRRVATPLAPLNRKLPDATTIFQDGCQLYLVHFKGTTLKVARWDGGGFSSFRERELPAVGRVYDIDVMRRGGGNIEIVFLCDKGRTSYRPDDPKYTDVSYYDGNQIYRGDLTRAGVKRILLDDDWHPVSRLENVTPDDEAIQGPVRIASVRSRKSGIDGYVIAGNLGSLKYIPYMKDIPAGGVEAEVLRRPDGSVRLHDAFSNQIVAYVDAKGEAGLLSGGESAVRVYGLENRDGTVICSGPDYLFARNAPLYGGSLTVPNVVDWNGDGALDIVAGNSEGRLVYFRNDGTDREPDFTVPVYVEAAGEPIHLRPGYHIVQGPYEGGWGYLCPTVFDWDGDGDYDVVVSGSRQKYEVFINEGSSTEPLLAVPKVIRHDGMELHGTWRVRPAIANVDGGTYMMIMDDDDALHLYRRLDNTNVEDMGIVHLENGGRITGYNKVEYGRGQPGRGKLRLFDWDGDGDLDLFVGSIKRSSYPEPENGLPYRRFLKKESGLQVMYFENVGKDKYGKAPVGMFAQPKQLQIDGRDVYLGAHSNAPEPCMLGDTSQGANIIVGCEQGRYMFFERSHITFVE